LSHNSAHFRFDGISIVQNGGVRADRTTASQQKQAIGVSLFARKAYSAMRLPESLGSGYAWRFRAVFRSVHTISTVAASAGLERSRCNCVQRYENRSRRAGLQFRRPYPSVASQRRGDRGFVAPAFQLHVSFQGPSRTFIGNSVLGIARSVLSHHVIDFPSAPARRARHPAPEFSEHSTNGIDSACRRRSPCSDAAS